MSACASASAPAPQQHTVTVTPAAPPSTSAPPPASAAPTPTATPTQPAVTSPWAVVSAYYGDIESGNYAEAWSLLSPSMQASLGPYSAWVAGYRTTTSTTVSELAQSGDTVTIKISAVQAGGSHTSYTGDYTVDNGKITSAHITQN